MRLRNLPPEAATVTLARQQEPSEDAGRPVARGERHLAPVRCLADIPVARSITEAGKFVNASGDEFSEMAGQAG